MSFGEWALWDIIHIPFQFHRYVYSLQYTTHINTLKAYKLSYNEDFICSADSFVRVQENHCLSMLTFNAKIELLNKSIKGKWCYFAAIVCNQWE